jgi:hypothetical protein
LVQQRLAVEPLALDANRAVQYVADEIGVGLLADVLDEQAAGRSAPCQRDKCRRRRCSDYRCAISRRTWAGTPGHDATSPIQSQDEAARSREST